MSKITDNIPKLRTGMVVVAPVALVNITANRKYIVHSINEGNLLIRNDKGEIVSYSTYQFIEADLYFTMCMFATMINIYNLGSKAYK